MTAIAGRVAKGAAFLDEHDPGWWRPDVDGAIDLDILDLDDPAHCVLGQRCPITVLAAYCDLSPADEDGLSYEAWRSYTAYAEVLSGITADAANFPGLAAWGDAHGFSNSAGWAAYPDLTAAWKRVIQQRRTAP